MQDKPNQFLYCFWPADHIGQFYCLPVFHQGHSLGLQNRSLSGLDSGSPFCITNKFYVFQSRKTDIALLCREFSVFSFSEPFRILLIFFR